MQYSGSDARRERRFEDRHDRRRFVNGALQDNVGQSSDTSDTSDSASNQHRQFVKNCFLGGAIVIICVGLVLGIVITAYIREQKRIGRYSGKRHEASRGPCVLSVRPNERVGFRPYAD
jgi:hypothetical protein